MFPLELKPNLKCVSPSVFFLYDHFVVVLILFSLHELTIILNYVPPPLHVSHYLIYFPVDDDVVLAVVI